MLVSTDIPSRLYDDGYIEFSNVTTKLDSASESFFFISTETDYVRIVIVSTYISAVGTDSINNVLPQESISITFTVDGFTSDNPDGPGTEEPGTEEPGTEEPGTEDPGTEDPGTERGCGGAIMTANVSVACIALIGCIVLLLRKRRA